MDSPLHETRRLLAETERQCQDLASQAMLTRYLVSQIQGSNQKLGLLYHRSYQFLRYATFNDSQETEATTLFLE